MRKVAINPHPAPTLHAGPGCTGAGSATAWTMSITANYLVEATGHRGDGARLRRVCVASGCASLQLAFTTVSPLRWQQTASQHTTSSTQICLQTVRSEPGS